MDDLFSSVDKNLSLFLASTLSLVADKEKSNQSVFTTGGFGKCPVQLWFTSARRRRLGSDRWMNSRAFAHTLMLGVRCAPNTKEVRQKPTLTTEESFLRAVRSAAGQWGWASFRKKVLAWCVGVCGNQCQNASQAAWRRTAFYIFQIMFSAFFFFFLKSMNFYELKYLPEN